MTPGNRGRALSTILLAIGAAVLLAACGSSSGSGSSSSSGNSAGAGKVGGTATLAMISYPDYLDPALSYTNDGWEVLTQTYPGLLVFQHKIGPEGAKVVPGLATAMPKISKDGKTYTFFMRKGLKFSNGKPLMASDFKWSISRVLLSDSQGVGLGYTNIVGAPQLLKTKKGTLTGIDVNDATGKIDIHLIQPRGPFTYELAIPFAGVVPKGTPAKNQTKNPPPGAGRYMLSNVKVNQSFTMSKNPNFSPVLKGSAIDTGKIDTFNVRVIRSAANAVTAIQQNKVDYMYDNPPADRTAELKAKYSDRFNQYPTTSTFYFFMNTEAPPFDNLKVRQAVNFAIDPDAINRVQGGVLAPANTILPPGIPGHKDWPNLYPHSLAKAKALVKASGDTGMAVTVWGDPEDPTKPTVEYYADVLNQIGFKATVKIVPAETYFATIGDRKLKVQTGWANWSQDYPHPADFIDVLLNPDRVVSTGNNNYSYNASDKKFASEINAVSKLPIDAASEKQWAAIDREAQEKAYWAVYGTRKQTNFYSTRMDPKCAGGYWPAATSDLAQLCLK
jgi:peptide/nickel transport system substrate-binding protein